MPTYTNDPVIINGGSDTEQLVVRGHTSQTKALQEWRKDASNLHGRITNDGRLQIGTFTSGNMDTDDSLIEAHRGEADTAKPKRGLHLMGVINEALTSVVSWVVHELTLKGTSISAVHSALRVRLRSEAAGASGNAELRGGDIEVINGATSGTMPTMTGLRVAVDQETGASATAVYGIKVELTDVPSSAYALHTNGGKVRFGGLSSGVLSVDANGEVTSGSGGGASALDDLTDVNTVGAVSGQVLTYNGSLWTPQAGGSGGSSSVPTGSAMPYFGATAPSGWLLCDGAAVSRTTYSALLAVVGDTYKRFTTLATRTSDTAGTIDLGAGHGITAGTDTLTLRFALAASTISAVNTTTDVITTSASHFLDTGDKVRVSSTATLPTGLIAATDYYVRVLSTTTFTLHPTLADAVGNTNMVNLTGAGTGTRTITPQDEGVRSGMTVASIAGNVLTVNSGTGHILPVAASLITVEGASNVFFLPDLRGRTAVGAGQGLGLSNRVYGTPLGEEMHQLTIAEMPSHSHTGTSIVATSGTNFYGAGNGNTGSNITIPAQGGNQPHNTMQPSLVTNYIIKA
jgi:microcystin-dependent protein